MPQCGRVLEHRLRHRHHHAARCHIPPRPCKPTAGLKQWLSTVCSPYAAKRPCATEDTVEGQGRLFVGRRGHMHQGVPILRCQYRQNAGAA